MRSSSLSHHGTIHMGGRRVADAVNSRAVSVRHQAYDAIITADEVTLGSVHRDIAVDCVGAYRWEDLSSNW